MNKKQYIVALGLAFTHATIGYAVNPATKEYVDAQFAILQSQIAAIGKQGAVVGGVTTAGDNISVTGAGTANDPYVVANSARRVGEQQDGGIIFLVDATGQAGLITATADEPAAAMWQDAMDACTNKAGDGWFLPTRTQLTFLWNNRYLIDSNDANGGFTINNYWSSTQSDAIGAWVQDFENGSQGLGDKFNNFQVRCVRAFT